MPAFDAHLNFAIGTVLSAPPDASGQDFTLMPGDGQAFAANMPVTMCAPNVKPNSSNSEIGYVTAVDGDALTILRAQERSIPMQVAANWQIFGSVTAKTVTDIEEAVAGKADAEALVALDQVVATKADKTELFSSDYVDLRGTPTLGTAAATDAMDYATAAQGMKADTAVQPGTLTKADVELGNVDNTSDINKPVSNPTQAALANKADLVDGKVPESQLPSFVDDVLSFNTQASFPAAGEDGKIYIAKDTNLTYRWTGSGYAEISPSLALGETASTAYRGDRGKTAYDHTLSTGNPHGTTKAQVGLSSVDDTSDANKPVSTAQAAALALKSNFPSVNNSVPTRNGSGNQGSLEYSYNATSADTLAVRSVGGTLGVGIPTSAQHATRKDYVDAADALKLNILDSRVPIYGAGSPNGVVAAPVGSTYKNTNRDPATWTGDMVWEKQSGIGNTGWVCISGDTGWRIIETAGLVGSTLRIRRINNEVIYGGGGSDFGTVTVASNSGTPAWTNLWASPIGFRASLADNFGTAAVAARNLIGYMYVGSAVDSYTVRINTLANPFPTTSLVRLQQVPVWTTDAWPTTLPGTAI